jgi:hypothetical protein
MFFSSKVLPKSPIHLTLHSTNHAYQLCQLANGRVRRTAERKIKSQKPKPYASRKDPAQPTSYRLIILLDTIGKLFEKILLNRVLYKLRELGLLLEKQFGFRQGHGTSVQLVRIGK